MQRSMLFGVVQAVFHVAVLASTIGPAVAPANAATTKADIDLRKHPTDGNRPVEVSVGLYVTNLVAIDENREI